MARKRKYQIPPSIAQLFNQAQLRGYFDAAEYPTHKLSIQQFRQLVEVLKQHQIPIGKPTISKKEALAIMGCCRKGTPPSAGISYISVGRQELLDSIRSDLDDVRGGTSQVRFINADLGQGKSHMLYLLRDVAFSQGFAVSLVTLSQGFCPLHRFIDVYREVIWGMRVSEERNAAALETMLSRWLEEMKQLSRDRVANIIKNLPEDIQNAMIAYYGARNPVRPNMERISVILNYLSAGQVTLRDLKPLGITRRIDEARALKMIGIMARLFRNLEYRGLCILFDEAEAIHSLSRIEQQERAYENLLRIVTETRSFPYCYFIYATTPSFFDAYSRFWPQKYWINSRMIYELNPMTNEDMAIAGQITANWLEKIFRRASFTMVPQSGSGGGSPMPRKPRVPMAKIAYPTRSMPSTSSGPRALGRISLNMMNQTLSPRVSAARI